MVFGGTVQFLEDTRRGLFSYEALRSRLADSRFAEEGHISMTAPVIRLRRLSDNELLALLCRLAALHAELYGIAPGGMRWPSASFVPPSPAWGQRRC